MDPCSVLTPDDLSTYGSFPPGKPETVGTSRTCRFMKDTDSPSTDPGRVIAVGFRDQQGLNDVQDMGMGIDRVEVDGREYAQVPSDGGCQVMIGVSDSSRVDITVDATEGTQKSCNIADEVGQIIEPKLPQG
ncbi:hypothetical protein HQ32_03010 [Prauserella sp. Am3]|nr:hypothetical protein HQ32_03010 [Prauserella sp. Am3]